MKNIKPIDFVSYTVPLISEASVLDLYKRVSKDNCHFIFLPEMSSKNISPKSHFRDN